MKKMKKLGLIGGTSWHSTIEYYRHINQAVNSYFGDNTNPPLLIYTLNQSLIHQSQTENNWNKIAELLIEAATSLKAAGAEAVMFCANTPHKVYEQVKQQINIPIIHIADTTANAIKEKGIQKVCFIGTKFSMEEDFITSRYAFNDIVAITPQDKLVINELHRIIQQELTFGNVIPTSKKYVLDAIQSMVEAGAEGVVLGCTEFPLMMNTKDISIPVFNTTEIHAAAGTQYILKTYL